MVVKQEKWPGTWTEQIGLAVQARRKEAGISAADLSKRCEEVGYPIPRNTITNLENGRKESLPVHELVVLARALEMSPVELLAPVGLRETIEVTPGHVRPTFDVAQWISGNGSSVDADESALTTVGSIAVHARWTGREDEGSVLSLWREHQSLVEKYTLAVDSLRDSRNALARERDEKRPNHEMREAVFVERIAALESSVNTYAESIATLRRGARDAGCPLPLLLGQSGGALFTQWEQSGTSAAVPQDEFERVARVEDAVSSHPVPPLNPEPKLIF